MRLLIARKLCCLVLAVAGFATLAHGGIVTVPLGLGPGATYRLVFDTGAYTNALSTNIADYNAFVTSEANSVAALAALGATWNCICSTEAVSAATNIGTTSSGIYTLDGLEVAVGTAALFNTGTTNLLNPIDINQYGNVWPNPVWDGTLTDGQSEAGYALGDATPIYGYSALTSTGYFQYYWESSANSLPVYAISSELTVPGGVPEPTTIGLTALGGAILVLTWRRKRPNRTPRACE